MKDKKLLRSAVCALMFQTTTHCKPVVSQQIQTATNLGTLGCTPQELERRAAKSRQTASNRVSVRQLAFQKSGRVTDFESYGLTNSDSVGSINSSDPCAAALKVSQNDTPIRDGLVTIDWKCSGRRRMISGGLKQDEYCEWERSQRKPGAALTCTFTTSFDHTRKFFLTSREKKESTWKDTQFNSYAYLAGGNEIDPKVTRRGIINHCLKRSCGAGDIEKPDYFGNCVASRASDPEICQVVNQAALKSGCTIEVPTTTTLTARPQLVKDPSIEGDREIKLYLRANGPIRKNCKHIIDPNFGSTKPFDPEQEGTLLQCDIPASESNFRSCDDVSDYIQVVASLKLSGCKR